MYRRMKLCSLKPKDIDFAVTDYFFELDESYLYTKISTSSLDEDDYFYKITLSNGDYFHITGNSENEIRELPIKYSDNRYSMFKVCVSGKYLIRPNVELADKDFDKKTLEVKIHIYQNQSDNNKLYVYATVPEVLQETVQIYYWEDYWVEDFDAGDGSGINKYNRYDLTIKKGYSGSNEVPYYNLPVYAFDVSYSISYTSTYYIFEYEYDY